MKNLFKELAILALAIVSVLGVERAFAASADLNTPPPPTHRKHTSTIKTTSHHSTAAHRYQHTYRRTYDPWRLSSYGNPTLDEIGFARVTYRYDERGNRVEQAGFGVDGKPTLNKRDGLARVTKRFDERGKQVEEAYFGVDGKPILHKDGYARWTARYDERGNRVERALFDADDHAVMVDGVGAKARYSYDDNDQLVSVVYLDENDQVIPVEVVVKEIEPGGTAARIGLMPGDRMLSYDGEPLRSTAQLVARTGKTDAGSKELTYRRGETTFSAQVPPGRLGVTFVNVRATSRQAATPEGR